MRLSNYINSGEHSRMLVMEVKGVSDNGVPIEAEEISKAIEAKERIKNRKDKILKELIMTPMSKARVKKDSKGYDAELTKYINALKKAAENLVNIQESTSIDLDNIVLSGEYSVQHIFGLSVGLVFEDFETGDFTNMEWEFSGNSPWLISTESPYEGEYCAVSGNISHNQTSDIFIEMEYETSMTLYTKVRRRNRNCA